MRENWQADQSSYFKTQNQSYELAHANIYLIYELSEHVKRTNLQIQNSKISTTHDNNRISKRSPMSVDDTTTTGTQDSRQMQTSMLANSHSSVETQK
ncbi:hypothetical protein STEG23_006014 [Scotinomys teguina]